MNQGHKIYAKVRRFRRLSVTLMRAAFLPEKGLCLRAALPQNTKVQIFSFESWIFHFYFSFSKNPNTPQSAVWLTAPLLKRGQPTGVRLRCEKKNCGKNLSF